MLGGKRRRDALLAEFEEHIAMETRENIEAGMPPEEARHAARKKFGNLLLAAEQSESVWSGVWLERIVRDLRWAVRGLRGAPAYTATLLCTLALGLGSVTAMLAIVESILLRPVALPDSDRLVAIQAHDRPHGTAASDHAISYKAIDELRRSTHSFVGLSGYNRTARPVTAADGARVGQLIEVTPDFFEMLGVQPNLGRLFRGDDGKTSVAVVNDEFWHERMHADRKAVGSTIKVSGQMRTIVGVLPAGFHVPLGTGGPLVYVPVSIQSGGQDEFLIESAATIARLKPGVSMEQALADAQSVFAHADRTNAEHDRHLTMRSYRELVTGEMQRPLLALLGGVAVLLLIACANAANLQIGRGASRLPEMAMRSALGASFGRLLQQLLTESVLVAMTGAALGGALAYGVIEAVRAAYKTEFARFDELSVDPVVLGVAFLVSLLVGAMASIAPALQVRRERTTPVTTRSATRRSGRLPRVLVAVQVALTCVLLVVSGLFVRTLQSLEDVKLGFDPHGVITLVLMPEDLNQSTQVSRATEMRLLQRLERLPGIEAVAMQGEVPFSNYNVTMAGTTEVSGRVFREGDAAFYSLVSTNFVQASGIRLLRGRSFVTADETSGTMAAMVNEAFVTKFLSGRDPLGATLHFHRNPGDTDADLPFTQGMTVVGVVENEIQGGDLGAPYEAMVYLDGPQLPQSSFLNQISNMSAQYALRSKLQAGIVETEVRRAVKEEAPGMVEMSLQPMEESIAQSLGQRKLALRLVAGFGLCALVLSGVGIYGVLAYSVALRRREIGIRMALGSSRGQASGLVMREAAWMVAFGALPGIAGAWTAGYAVRSFLYGVKVFDGWTLCGAAAVLLLVSLGAAFVPAWKAAQVDPVETLRAE